MDNSDLFKITEEGFALLNERLSSYIVNNKLNYIDVRGKCRFERKHFRDVIHFTDEGERFFAECLYPEFKRHMSIFLETKNIDRKP